MSRWKEFRTINENLTRSLPCLLKTAAHGGQVACEQSLVESALSAWRQPAPHVELSHVTLLVDSTMPASAVAGAENGAQEYSVADGSSVRPDDEDGAGLDGAPAKFSSSASAEAEMPLMPLTVVHIGVFK